VLTALQTSANSGGAEATAARSDLKDWAGKIIPTLKHHLEMAESLKD
jgi:hypothetical protein